MTVHKYQLGNVEIRVYRPDMSEDELKRREKTIHTALQQIGRDMAAEKRGRDIYDNSESRTINQE